MEFYTSRKGKFYHLIKFKIERTQYAETNILVQPYGNPDKLTIDLSVRIPRTQKVRYTPGILETLKYAWI